MRCPKCNYNNLEGTPVCNLCGEMLFSYGAGYPPSGKARAGGEQAPPPGVRPKPAAPEPDPKTLRYQLVCFPLNPVDLRPSDSYSIGRAPENDIILPVGMVSRKHARIEWRSDGFHIADQDSHNGTIVNGSRVSDALLRHGDQIKVGPYLLEFYSGPGDSGPAVRRDAKMDATQDMAPMNPETAGPFSGKLSEIELREIVHLLNVTRKSGKLEIKMEKMIGEVHFLEGDIIDAKWGKEPPLRALAAMLGLRNGSFRFMRDFKDFHRTLHGPTSKILIDALRLCASGT